MECGGMIWGYWRKRNCDSLIEAVAYLTIFCKARTSEYIYGHSIMSGRSEFISATQRPDLCRTELWTSPSSRLKPFPKFRYGYLGWRRTDGVLLALDGLKHKRPGHGSAVCLS